MPLSLTRKALTNGHAYVHAQGSGAVSGSEARDLMTRIAPGADLAGLPILAVIEGKVDLAPEARKALATLNSREGTPVKVALVTPNAPMRVLLSFVIRLSPQVNETKFFGDAAEALAWLEKE